MLRNVILKGDGDVAKGISELQIEFSGLGFLEKDVMSVLFKKFILYDFVVIETCKLWKSV